MSKTAEEQATEIVVALLSTEKGVAYVAATPELMGKNLATVWKDVFAAIRDADD